MQERGPRQVGAKRAQENRSQTSRPVQPKKGRSQKKHGEPREEDGKDRRSAVEGVATHDNQIHDILDDRRAQMAYLLYSEADRQHPEVAGKVMVKNWWQYVGTNEEGSNLQAQYREAMINSIAIDAAGDTRDSSSNIAEANTFRNSPWWTWGPLP